MQETTARKLKQKTVAGIFMLAVMLFLLTGCGTSSVFDGSRASDDGHAPAKRRGALADGGHLRGEGRERGPACVQADCWIFSCWESFLISASVSRTAALALLRSVLALDTASALRCMVFWRALHWPSSFLTSSSLAAYSCFSPSNRDSASA